MADGITPGKVDQAYVLRRLIRRAIREARSLNVPTPFTAKLAKVVIDNYKEFYPELAENEKQILEEFEREENMFADTLERGMSSSTGAEAWSTPDSPVPTLIVSEPVCSSAKRIRPPSPLRCDGG